jgi:hypothetical protein
VETTNKNIVIIHFNSIRASEEELCRRKLNSFSPGDAMDWSVAESTLTLALGHVSKIATFNTCTTPHAKGSIAIMFNDET